MTEKKEKETIEENGVKPNTDPLSALSPEARKLFEETQAGLLSALKAEREASAQSAKRAEALEKAAQDAETRRLKESENYKELYEAAETKIASLTPQAEKLGAYEKTLKETLDAQIAAIPEDKRSLIPEELPIDAQLKWISRNRELLSKSQPMSVGAGIRGGGESGRRADLSIEELEMARAFGMTPEEYAKNK